MLVAGRFYIDRWWRGQFAVQTLCPIEYEHLLARSGGVVHSSRRSSWNYSWRAIWNSGGSSHLETGRRNSVLSSCNSAGARHLIWFELQQLLAYGAWFSACEGFRNTITPPGYFENGGGWSCWACPPYGSCTKRSGPSAGEQGQKGGQYQEVIRFSARYDFQEIEEHEEDLQSEGASCPKTS